MPAALARRRPRRGGAGGLREAGCSVPGESRIPAEQPVWEQLHQTSQLRAAQCWLTAESLFSWAQAPVFPTSWVTGK